jgi:hypothetical protein
LELELAKARGIPVRLLNLKMAKAIPIWNFSMTEEMFVEGYKQMKRTINDWESKKQPEEKRQPWVRHLWNKLIGN